MHVEQDRERKKGENGRRGKIGKEKEKKKKKNLSPTDPYMGGKQYKTKHVHTLTSTNNVVGEIIR